MTKPQEFTIQVQSEDPKKKEKPSDNKQQPDLAGSSKPLKDAKEGDGEELVRDNTIHILNIFLSCYHSQKRTSSSRIN
jgi:hypothetical protein